MSDERDHFSRLNQRLQTEFKDLAPAIVRVIVEEWGDQRLTVPGFRTLQRLQRDDLIRRRHRGNVTETALYFSVSESTVRRAIE